MIPLIFAPSVNRSRNFLGDADLWWHLADARLLTSTHHFVRIEPYSFTVAGHRWVDPEWLAEMPFWLSYRAFGLMGIYLVTWLALGANVVLVYWRGYLKSRHGGAAFFAAGLAFFLMTANAGPRTIAFAYLAMSAEMALLEAAERGHKRLLWLMCPLFCIWINLHGSWLIGFCVFILYVSAGFFTIQLGSFEQTRCLPADQRRLVGVLVASLASLFLNPYGWRLLWNPIDMMVNQQLNITFGAEWQPLEIGSARGLILLAALAIIVLAGCIRGGKWTLFDTAIVFLAVYSAFAHTRFTYMAAVLITPIVAVGIRNIFYTESDNKTIPFMNALIAAAAGAVIFFALPSEHELQDVLSEKFPLQSIASIQPGWRTFNVDFVGGMMDFESKSTFIDSRFDSFEHSGVLKDFLSITDLHAPLQLMEKYKIDHVLYRQNASLTRMLEQTPGWHVLRKEASGYELLAHDGDDSSGISTCSSVVGGN
ncbi:MAG TPA: hypothetical protein VKR52_06615 [Terracidiphilus sp.]|nr:hypothetical protein [Terracidiphilus sp.]